jgi:ADP-heptose:LPS heptosyltransferase
VERNVNQVYKIKNQVPQRIIILRALQLGDLMCAVPAFRALRAAFPRAEISLVGLPWARDFVQRFNSYLDNFIEFPGYPGLPEQYPQIHKLPVFLREIQNQRYDLALQMQGSGATTNSLVSLFGAVYSAGYFLPGQYCPDEDTYLLYPVHEPEVRRHLNLIKFLGMPSQGEHLEFPIYERDLSEFSGCARAIIFPLGIIFASILVPGL